MAGYLLGRVAQGFLVILLVSLVVFVLINMTGDPTALLLPPEASPEQIAEFRSLMGFDQPLPFQYATYVSRAVQGDFGESIRWRQPALQVVLERLPATLALTGVALLITLCVAVPLGILSALRPGSAVDQIGLVTSVLGQAMPSFWLGGILILLFSVYWQIFPTSGGGSLEHLVLPGITLAVFSIALVARLLRGSLVDVLNSHYVRTARGKGLHERRIVLSHALKNAAIPVITVIGVQVGTLLGGIVVVETVFGYPGMGRLLYQAVGYKDIPVVQVIVILMAFLTVVISLALDLIYTVLDPRVRHG